MSKSVTSGSGSAQFFPQTPEQLKILRSTRAWLNYNVSNEEYNRLVKEALKEKTEARKIYKLDSLSRKVRVNKHGNPVDRASPLRGKSIVHIKAAESGGQVGRGHPEYSTRGRQPNEARLRTRIWDSDGNVRPTTTQKHWNLLERFKDRKPLTESEINTIQGWKTKGFGKEGQLKSQQPGSRSITSAAAPESVKNLRFDLQRWNQFMEGGHKDQVLRQRYGLLSPDIPSHRLMKSGELNFDKSRLSPDHLITRATQEALKDVAGNIQVDTTEINRARQSSTTIGQFKNAILNILRGKTSSSREARLVANKFLDYFNKGVLQSTGVFLDTKKRKGLSTRHVPTDYSTILESVNKLPLTKEVYTDQRPFVGRIGDIKIKGITRDKLASGLMNFLDRFKVGETKGGAPIYKGDINDAPKARGIWRFLLPKGGGDSSGGGGGGFAGGRFVKNPKTGRREWVIM